MRNGDEYDMNLKKLTLVAVTAALVCAAIAQPGQGRRGGGFGNDALTLVTSREDVKKELNITDDQKAKLTELADKVNQQRREAGQAAREAAGDDQAAGFKAMQEASDKVTAANAPALAAILSADQLKRLNEIRVQIGGMGLVASDKEIQKTLEITDDQRAKFSDLQTRQRTAMTELFQKMRDGDIDQAAMRDTMTKNRKVMDDEIAKVMTDAQKSKYKDMGGKTFTQTDPPRQFGGGGGGGR